ncbi:MAG TPA: FkbM family methyltransferase [Conexibacter sp.]|jgi:FkbM family methyltransferase|nr:FkbM family methyltransferase [Conexibacter sp.]
MASPLRTTTAALRRSARSAVVRSGREEQARALLGHVREARSAFDPGMRRVLRDEHAMRVVLATALRRDGNAIDVGANRGDTLDMILAVAPDGRHVAYEPIPGLAEQLAARYPGVDVRNAACSDEAGNAEFTHVLNAPAMSGLRQREDLPAHAAEVERFTVRLDKLDEALPEGYVPSLVKIDVEGAELLVMRGAAETLARHRPYVIFEHGVGGADLYGSKPGEVFDLLDGCGLRIFDLEGDGPYTRDRFEAVFTEPIWNFLAAPA